MGQFFSRSETSPFSNSKYINQLIETDQWQLLLEQGGAGSVVEIDLNTDGVNPFKHKYIIKYNSEIPANCIMSVFFPNHSDWKKRILWTSGDLSTLSREINERLGKERELVVSSGTKFYRFRGITGTVYLVWAEYINQQNINNLEKEIAQQVPVLIELDKHWGYKHIYVFGNTEVTNLCDVQTFDPFMYSIFCCETDSREQIIRKIQTVTNLEADQVTKDLVDRTVVSLDNVEAPFE